MTAGTKNGLRKQTPNDTQFLVVDGELQWEENALADAILGFLKINLGEMPTISTVELDGCYYRPSMHW